MGYDGHPTGCPCATCGHHRRVRRESNRRARARRRNGESTYGDADAVATHLRSLVDAGCAQRWIADVAGVRPETVSDLLHLRRRRVYATTAAALLAVRPRQATRTAAQHARSLIPAVGTVRRLRALAAIGHPLYRIAGQAGVARPHVRLLAGGSQRLVTTPVARVIAATYDRLWNSDGGSVHTRNRAARLGWVPPLAWDDDTIDNPAAKPLPYARRRVRHSGDALAADAAELIRQGLSRADTAERLGVTRAALDAAYARHTAKETRHDVA